MFRTINSLRMSFCMVPLNFSGETPCSSAAMMYKARTGKTAQHAPEPTHEREDIPETSLNFRSAVSLWSILRSGCHFSAAFLYAFLIAYRHAPTHVHIQPGVPIGFARACTICQHSSTRTRCPHSRRSTLSLQHENGKTAKEGADTFSSSSPTGNLSTS